MMGKISDDIINGDCCALCGCYFVQLTTWEGESEEQMYSHGYPVACNDCYDENCGYEKQYKKAIAL